MSDPAFAEVHCPVCNRKVAELVIGLVRVRCSQCKHRLTISRLKAGAVKVLVADRTIKRDQLLQTA